MPKSLQAEIHLSVFKEIVSKVKLFAYGDPIFVVLMLRQLKPSLNLEGDSVVRKGEIADRF